MANWETFEVECYEKLQKDYGEFAKILPHGKSDSTKPDIEIRLPNGNNFFIEIKSKNAQCCQFVLFPENKTKTFRFSERNKMKKTEACKTIIEYMEKNYSRYCKPTQSGIAIDVTADTLYNLVDEYYSPKLVKFFMTQDYNGKYIIFPAAKFKNYFNITSCYRKKKSGSSEPSEIHISEIEQALIDYSINGSIDITKVDKPRCFLTTCDNGLHKKRLICNDYTYQLKTNEHSKRVVPPHRLAYIYEIRKLSNTNNPNVICQLELKDVCQDSDDLKSFENLLK